MGRWWKIGLFSRDTVKLGPILTDVACVSQLGYPQEKLDRPDAGRLTDSNAEGWSLSLTARSGDQPQRLVRFLTGALLSCGGWVLTRSTLGDRAAELDFEFARACCVDIYAILVASGLELSRDSHLQMTELCHCTNSLLETCAFDIVRAGLVVHRSSYAEDHDEYAAAMAG